MRGAEGRRLGIALLFVAAGVAYGAWAVSVAGDKVALGLSDGVLGAALLCVAAGAMVAMPIAGWLGARGVRGLLTGSGVVVAVVLPFPAVVGDAGALAASLLGLGAAAGSLDVAMNARASRFEQESGRALMSSFHAAFSLGGLLGTVVAAASSVAGGGVAGGLLVGAVVVAGCTAAHAWLERDGFASARASRSNSSSESTIQASGESASNHRAPDPKASGTAPGRAGGGRVGWPGRALAAIGALCLLAFLTEGAIADWSGVFLRDVAGFGEAASASGYAAFSIGMIAARLLGDAWVRRFGAARVLLVGSAVAACGVGLAMAVPAAGAVGFGLVGVGGANAAPILFSSAGRAGAAASTGIAAVATLGYAGMLVGPAVIGGLAELAGLRAALALLAAAMVAIAAASRLVNRGPAA